MNNVSNLESATKDNESNLLSLLLTVVLNHRLASISISLSAYSAEDNWR